ncbi:penicillin-binding protein 1b [Klebsiella michiganensis]|uniref:Penicillin-binding protein 1b n=1 Tax=Klebsiella michiganensis TaxID=1134687 RepID=A0A7H4N7A4_9ENTR|nr:penicillin-binding protein 1b [Klebsiella michiganensis]
MTCWSARPLGVQPRGGVISPQPAFMQMVRQELQAKLGDKVKDLSGVKIFTTFDSVAQDAAEKAATEGIPALKKQRKLPDLETAMVVVDRFTGEVRAMVGGAEPQFAGYNRAMQGAPFNWFTGKTGDLSDRAKPAEPVSSQYLDCRCGLSRFACLMARRGRRRTTIVATAIAVK